MSEPPADPPLVVKVEPGAEVPLPPLVLPRPARPGFWESLLWCLILLAMLILGAVVGTGVAFTVYALEVPNPGQFAEDQLGGFVKATAPKGQGDGEPPRVPFEIGNALAWGLLSAQVFSFALVAFVLPQRVGRDWKRQLAVRRPAAIHLLIVLLLVPAFMLSADAVQTAFTWLTGVRPDSTSPFLKGIFGSFPWPLTALAVAVGPGVVEELWFRGFLGRGLVSRYGFASGIVLTSVLFGLMHGNPAQLPAYVLMGAYLHGVYLATRSIWPPILLHSGNNGLAVLVELNVTAEQLEGVPAWAAYLCAGAILVFGSVALWTSRAKPELIPDGTPWTPGYPGVSAPPPGSDVLLACGSVNPVAVVLTVIAFGAMMYLAYTYLG